LVEVRGTGCDGEDLYANGKRAMKYLYRFIRGNNFWGTKTRPKLNTFHDRIFLLILFEFRKTGSTRGRAPPYFPAKYLGDPRKILFGGIHRIFLGTPYILFHTEIKSLNFEAVEASMAQVEEKRNTVC
jgi:hypothetical protein